MPAYFWENKIWPEEYLNPMFGRYHKTGAKLCSLISSYSQKIPTCWHMKWRSMLTLDVFNFYTNWATLFIHISKWLEWNELSEYTHYKYRFRWGVISTLSLSLSLSVSPISTDFVLFDRHNFYDFTFVYPQACNHLECGFDAGDCGTDNYNQLSGLNLRKETDPNQHYEFPPGIHV